MMFRRFRVLILFLAVLLVPFAAAESEGEFDYKLLDDGNVMLTGYNGSGRDIAFPETIDGYTVYGLSGTFGANTASIANIRSITIPNTLTEIEPGAFRFAQYLTEIHIADDHPVLSFADGVLYSRKDRSLLHYLQTNTAEHFDVPDGIIEIADKAFVRAGLHSVSIPGSVERIGSESFYQCSRLKKIALSEGLKTIGADTFTNCDMLREIEIPASVTDIAESVFTDAHLKEIRVAQDSAVFAVSGGALINTREGVLIAFPPFSEAESCVIPEGVTRIARFAFYRCHNLKQVVFPKTLREIGQGAFLMCNHLTGIDLPDGITRLEERAFGINSDSEQLHLPGGLTEIVNNFDDLAISELKIPETVKVIEKSFTSLPKLTEVVIPHSVTTIGSGSFVFCRNLASITIPASVTDIRSTFIGCTGNLVFRVEPGSFAEQYCREHKLEFEYISE